jgi:hypothetical protein
MICHTEVETGSLVRSQKVCATAADWEAQSTNARKQAQGLQSGRVLDKE